jgi:hypothetical protein
MPYLNCPTCRLTVYVPPKQDSLEQRPRCSGRLGAVRKLFPSRARPGGSKRRLRRSALDTLISTRRARSSPPRSK